MADKSPVATLPIDELGHGIGILANADPNEPVGQVMSRLAAGPPKITPADLPVAAAGGGSNLLAGLPSAATAPTAYQGPSSVPPPGLFARIGHGLETVGKDLAIGAGTEFAPRVMPWIAGTPQYERRLQMEGEEQKAEQARQGLEGAQKNYYDAQAYKDAHPPTPTEKADWHPVSGTNREINYASGEVRPMEGVPEPQDKPAPEKAQWVTDDKGNVSYLPESMISGEPGKYKPYKALGNMTPLQLFLSDPEKFKEYMAAMKGNAIGSKYAMVRLLGEVANYYPGLAPLIPQALEQAGLNIPPDIAHQDLLAGQPRNIEGQRVGLRMPEAPTGAVRTRGQMAQDVIQRIPDIEGMVNKLAAEGKLGPGVGRVHDLLSGKIGANDPDFRRLADQMETLASAFSRLHLNTEKGLEPFFQMLNTGKMTPDNLKAGLKTLRDWSETYRYTGSGNQPDLRPSGGGPKAGTVEDGYRFKGGDPSKASSWEKAR